MKYKTRDYAKALAQIFLEKGEKINEKKFSQGFLKLLQKQGDLKKSREIINSAKILLAKKEGNKVVVLESARKLSAGQKDLFSKFIKKGDIVEEKIAPELIAGVKIIIDNEKQLDQTFLKKINSLLNN